MKMYLKVMGCSCYTCLPRTALAAAQTGQKAAAPGTGTDASPVVQRLLTIATPKQVHIYTYIQTRAKTKNKHQTQESYKGTH